jgi:hypothetical protein
MLLGSEQRTFALFWLFLAIHIAHAESLEERQTLWESKALTCVTNPGAISFPTKYTGDQAQPCDDGDMTLFVCVSASRLEHRRVRCEGVAIVTAEHCDGRPNRRDCWTEDSATSSARRGILARDGHGVETKRTWRTTFLP